MIASTLAILLVGSTPGNFEAERKPRTFSGCVMVVKSDCVAKISELTCGKTQDCIYDPGPCESYAIELCLREEFEREGAP